jgi:hypothetical protein
VCDAGTAGVEFKRRVTQHLPGDRRNRIGALQRGDGVRPLVMSRGRIVKDGLARRVVPRHILAFATIGR